MFRRKLRIEIAELEHALEFGTHALPEIQVNIYCIASLIRRIIQRVPIYKGFSVKVIEDRNRQKKHIKFEKLIDRIIHFHMLSYGWRLSSRPSKFDRIHIISDLDIKDGLSVREISTKDFVDIAKKIATDDNSVLKSLIEYTIDGVEDNLKHHDPSNKNGTIPHYGIEIGEALVDVFNLVRKIDFKNKGILTNSVSDNEIVIMFEVLENLSDTSKVIKRESCKITYEQFAYNSGHLWNFVLDSWHIDIYRDKSKFEIKDKTIMLLGDPYTILKSDLFCNIGIDPNRKKNRIRCMILAEDLLKLLDDFKNVY